MREAVTKALSRSGLELVRKVVMIIRLATNSASESSRWTDDMIGRCISTEDWVSGGERLKIASVHAKDNRDAMRLRAS